jgi:N-acetylmuramoyl-L-alanine amidase
VAGIVGAIVAWPTTPSLAAPSWVPLRGEAGLRASLENGRDLALLVQARSGDDYARIAARYLGPGRPVSGLSEANPGRARVVAGSWYRVPIALLSPSWLEKTLRSAFPADSPDENGWVHRPAASSLDTYGEGAWELALWYTGDGRNFDAVMRANGLTDPILPRGARVTVPAHLLLGPFRAAWEKAMREGAARRASAPTAPLAPPSSTPSPSAPATAPSPSTSTSRIPDGATGSGDAGGEPDDAEEALGEETERSSDADRPGLGEPAAGAPLPGRTPQAATAGGPSELTFAKDGQGSYAAYRLKPGEALYSSVVVRFTGRVDPEDVGEAAAAIARRSGIAEMTNIPSGYTVKIPRDMVLPEFLPPDDRKRRAVEELRREAESVKNPVRSRNLQGIHVILDAGHGGIDPGAFIGGVAEHEVAYDVLCRVKRLLEAETGATVHPIIEDPAGKFEPRGGRILRASGREEILTTPAHVNGDASDTSLGVNLRWLLANAIQRKLVRSGVDPGKIVFASFHADVLHPSLRGAMVYVPGERYRRGSYACYDPDCAQYAEARGAPVLSFSKTDRVKSEGLSREFAGKLVRALGARGIRIHPYQPVRDRIIRRGRTWLPAVLRGNTVPVKVLVEMANLNNPDDRSRLQDPSFRESFARAFTDALLAYYRSGGRPGRGGR